MSEFPSNPIAAFVALAVIFLGGGGITGAVISILKARREGEREEVDLTALVKKVAAETINDLREEKQQLIDRIKRLERKVDDLEVDLTECRAINRQSLSHITDWQVYASQHLPDRKDYPEPPRLLRMMMMRNEGE